jgi:hypothetical protein
MLEGEQLKLRCCFIIPIVLSRVSPLEDGSTKRLDTLVHALCKGLSHLGPVPQGLKQRPRH